MSSNIFKVQLFIEISWLEENMTVTGLDVPFEFIEFADQELDLNGELNAYVKERMESIKIEKINKLNDDERSSFYSNRTTSPLWKTYFRSTEAGYRYSILVEFNAECAHGENSEQGKNERTGVTFGWEGITVEKSGVTFTMADIFVNLPLLLAMIVVVLASLWLGIEYLYEAFFRLIQ